MKNLKKLVVLVLTLAMVASLAACGGGSDDSASAEGKYAVILKTQATDFWKQMNDGVAAYAEENGIDLYLAAAQSDSDDAGQLAILEQCVNDGYTGIAIAPVNAAAMVSGVKAANDAGVTVVNIDEQFDPGEMENQGAVCAAFVSSDNKAIGQMGAEYISEGLEAGSEVAIIAGIAGNVSSEDRQAGAEAGFEAKGMNLITVQNCDWDMQKALDAAATLIQQNPNLKAIYCCNDGMAAGVRQAIANAGKTGEILLCGTDGDADAIQAVAEGTMAATVAQDPAAIGVKGLELLIDACTNPDNYEPSAAPEKTPVDAILVTAENAADMM